MPTLQNLVLTDRATPTPVDHTYTPADKTAAGVGMVREDNGVPFGSPQLSISKRVTATGRHKAILQLAIPTVITETVNGQPVLKVRRVANLDLSVSFDKESTEQERNNAIGQLQSALAPSKVLINDVLVKLQGVW